MRSATRTFSRPRSPPGSTTGKSALADYDRRRNAASLPIYEFTEELDAFAPPKVEERVLFEALAGDEAATARFLLVLTGAVPLEEYFAPRNLLGVIGPRGMARVMLGKLRTPASARARRGALATA